MLYYKAQFGRFLLFDGASLIFMYLDVLGKKIGKNLSIHLVEKSSFFFVIKYFAIFS